jgi:hypothetical protein
MAKKGLAHALLLSSTVHGNGTVVKKLTLASTYYTPSANCSGIN